MVSLGGTAPAVPRWLLDAAQRIERYMAEHNAGEWAVGGIQKRSAAPQASEAVRDAQDATGRTPTAYALEFAEYLARDAEYVMACLNASQRANEALLDLAEEVTPLEAYQAAEEAAAQADEAFTEAITGLQSGIFEFRKRRDRAAQAPAANADALDAARYRWLRGHFRFAADSECEIWFDGSLKHSPADQLDAAIDAARAAGRERDRRDAE